MILALARSLHWCQPFNLEVAVRNSLTRATLWSAAAIERAALADDLAGLHEAQWAQ